MNSGACGTVCTGGGCPPPLCKYGLCTKCCGPGMCDCNGTGVDLQTDHSNGGTCGNVCKLDEVCSAGACLSSLPVSITVTC